MTSVSLTVATLPQVISWVRQIPYTLLLVIVGLGLALLDIHLVELYPELILSIFLPPLLFEAAWNLDWSDLKRDLFPISLLAVAGVVITILGVAFTLHWGMGMALPIALVVGACLAATDPVAVVALFKELGAPKRLKTLVDGESLFNDGVAVVAFTLLVGIPLGVQEFSLQETVARFGVFVGLGIAVGVLVGFGISYFTQRFDLPLVEQSLTLVAAYGTYLITEELGGSGVIGVVTAGVILGNFGSRIGMSPRTRLIVAEFWEFIAFFVNSIVFLLIGNQIRFSVLLENFPLIAVTIGAVLLTRLLAVFSLSAISNWLVKSDIDWKIQLAVWSGGASGWGDDCLGPEYSRRDRPAR
ncbi:sodium:proton antiporter [Neosynechococcus sphagnicola]|uniref:cation:proton antiporter n=1 Tax=Neosynechococcus sphagnicola TaxID=1501145 RepID=UPI0030840AE5